MLTLKQGDGRLDSAPLIAASIFLDALNVFLFFLQLFSSNRDDHPPDFAGT